MHLKKVYIFSKYQILVYCICYDSYNTIKKYTRCKICYKQHTLYACTNILAVIRKNDLHN